jgi:hypothetical protein
MLEIGDEIERAVFSQRTNEPFAPKATAVSAITFRGSN